MLPFLGAGKDSSTNYAVQGVSVNAVFSGFTSLWAIFLLSGLTVLLEIQASGTHTRCCD